jgi:hypothetical protein
MTYVSRNIPSIDQSGTNKVHSVIPIQQLHPKNEKKLSSKVSRFSTWNTR